LGVKSALKQLPPIAAARMIGIASAIPGARRGYIDGCR